MLIGLLLLLFGTSKALSPAQWRTQSIYQVLTDRFARTDGSTTALCDLSNYCGGTFRGLMNRLDYIQGMGFTAIWISPIVANLDTMTPYGLPYHGYWGQDFYTINPHFGTAADLKALSAALHARGMYLMVDIVTNHVGFNGSPANVYYSLFNPFNKQSYYHSYCRIDYENTTSVQDCWAGDSTVSLPDLRTEDTVVQNMFSQWISQLVSNYSIDGLRLDSVQQVNKAFWPSFLSAAGVYAIGEVLNGSPSFLCDYQNYIPGMLDYATYFWLVRAFTTTASSLAELANGVGWLQATCADTTLMGSFMENQDNPRWPAFTNDTALTANALAFTMLRDGIPIIYYGQEHGFTGSQDPYNREPFWTSGYSTTKTLYKYIARLNTIRKLAIARDTAYATDKAVVAWSDPHTLILRKGGSSPRILSIFTNSGSASRTRQLSLSSTWSGHTANTAYTDLLSCAIYTTDSQGNVNVTITNGMPLALYKTSDLSGSTICPSAAPTYEAAPQTSSASSKVTSPTTSMASSSAQQPTTFPQVSIPTCPGTNNTLYYPPSSSTPFQIQCGIDYVGGDMSTTTSSTFQTCIKNCGNKKGCVGVAYVGGTCYLKDVLGRGVASGGVLGAKVYTG